MVLRTTSEPETPVEASPLNHLRDDDPLAVTLPMNAWGGMLVERMPWMSSSGIVWRTPREERRLASRMPLKCAAPWPGTPEIWCLLPDETILFRVDTGTPRLTRLPGDVPWRWDVQMLGPSLIAAWRGEEIQVVDLTTRRGTRLKLPKANLEGSSNLIEGGLATLARRGQAGAGTLVVYQNPFQ
jgi:hypothetical protein